LRVQLSILLAVKVLFTYLLFLKTMHENLKKGNFIFDVFLGFMPRINNVSFFKGNGFPSLSPSGKNS
jgi:hypothetical protein